MSMKMSMTKMKSIISHINIKDKSNRNNIPTNKITNPTSDLFFHFFFLLFLSTMNYSLSFVLILNIVLKMYFTNNNEHLFFINFHLINFIRTLFITRYNQI